MTRTLVGALALAVAPSALAFRNTSPFFLFSTADVLLPNAHDAVANAVTVTSGVVEALKHCPTQSYLIVEQHGVSAADYLDATVSPHLSQYMRGNHDAVRSTFSMNDVVDRMDADALYAQIQSACAPKGGANLQVQRLGAPTSNRKHDLQTNDATLEDAIRNSKTADFTVIYITTPRAKYGSTLPLEADRHPHYDIENPFSEAVHMELKRDYSSTATSANSTNSGLFERYQYFTPGLFMGFAAIIPLFFILLVGVRALLSLEVSYFAFSKEMGPNAQKKQ